MDLRTKEVQDGFKWLMLAGSAAVLFSMALFWADNTVMGGAAARDKVHNESLRDLRVAQAALPARVTDPRQTLPLSIEGAEKAAAPEASSH